MQLAGLTLAPATLLAMGGATVVALLAMGVAVVRALLADVSVSRLTADSCVPRGPASATADGSCISHGGEPAPAPDCSRVSEGRRGGLRSTQPGGRLTGSLADGKVLEEEGGTGTSLRTFFTKAAALELPMTTGCD